MHIEVMVLTMESRNRGNLNYTYNSTFFIKNTKANMAKS